MPLLAALATLTIVLPPAKYDHTPAVPPAYQFITAEAMQLICFRDGPLVYSCTRRNRLGWCDEYLPDITDPNWPEFRDKKMDEDDVAMLKRHEDGHCNGWSANHEGAVIRRPEQGLGD